MKDLKEPAPLKPASTVLLIRDNSELEVLMVVRNYEIDFVPGAHVFPGGKISDDDRNSEWDQYTIGNHNEEERALRIGAVREIFEESGILIARASDQDDGFVSNDACIKLAQYRHLVDKGELSFLELIKAEGLQLCLDNLVPYAHWITPEFMPKRFDTYFFILRTPDGQSAVHDGRETTQAVWLSPNKVLKQNKAGKANVVFPTRLNIELLAESSSVCEAITASQKRELVPVMPVLEKNNGDPIIRIRDDAGYKTTTESMEKVPGQ